MIIGSLSGPLCAAGGFCAGNEEVVEHQRISSASYTYSAALPALLSTTASETISMLQEQPDILTGLRENIKAMRGQLDPRSDWVRCSSSVENPIMLLVLKDEVIETKNLSIDDQNQIFRDVVDEVCFPLLSRAQASCLAGIAIRTNQLVCAFFFANHPQCLANGVLITRLKSFPLGIGLNPKDAGWQPTPALKVCVTSGLTRKETEKAGTIIRHAITKIVSRRK
jgi:serine palmitoyltransferase